MIMLFRHKEVLYLNGSYLGGHFFLGPAKFPVIPHIHDNESPIESRLSFPNESAISRN
jgi:hypothetical protein